MVFSKTPSVKTVPHSVEWHESRRLGIGGSDLDHLINGSGYGCERRLAMDKLGIKEDFPDVDNFRFRRGHRLEPVAAQYYYEEYKRAVHRDQPTFVDGILRTNPDGFAVTEGRVYFLELKTLGVDSFKKYKKQGLPPHYIAQGHWGAGITKVNLVSFGIYSPELDEIFKVDLEFNQDLFNELKTKAQLFWEKYIVNRDELPAQIEELSVCKKCPFRKSCQKLSKSGIMNLDF